VAVVEPRAAPRRHRVEAARAIASARAAALTAVMRCFWAIPEARRFHELIGGDLIEKAVPFHGGGSGGPGGWWIASEVEVLLETGEIVRPDVLGWRRDRCPARPTGTPVRQRPDWICRIISPSNANDDTVVKLRLYHRVGVEHYWMVDPRDATLTVMRWSADGYVTLLRAVRGEVVRAEPFAAVEIAVGTLFGDDPP
jgi:hypothetical protein